jgi:hypothetical protein
MTLPIALPYGLRDVKVIPYPDLSATEFGTTLVDLPYVQTFEFTEAEEYTDLRGDDRLITSHGQGPQVDWTLTAGGMSMEAYVVINGGNIYEDGVTPDITKRYRKLVTDQRPFFTVIGQSISDSGGDVHGIVYRARSTGDLAGTFGDGEFYIPSASGIGYACKVEGLLAEEEILDAVYDFAQHEQIMDIVAPALDTP